MIIGVAPPGSGTVRERADEGGEEPVLGFRRGTPKRNLILFVAYLLTALVALGIVREMFELLALEGI